MRPMSGTTPHDSRAVPWFGRAMVVLGLFVTGALIVRAGPFAVLHAMERVGAGFVLIVLAPIVGMVLHCWGWLVLLPRAARPSPALALYAHVAAQAGDELGAGVAGEPLKLLASRRPFRNRAAMVLAVDNVAQIVAVGGFMLASSCTLLLVYPRSRSGNLPWLAIAGASLAALGVMLPLLICGGIRRSRLRDFALAARLTHALSAARIFIRRRPRRVLGSVLLHGLGKAWILPEMALTLKLLGASPAVALWLAPMSVLGSLLGTMIPGQAGAIEAALALGGAMAGADPATVMALAVLRRLRTGCWIVAGGLLVRKVIERGQVSESSLRSAP